MQNPINHQNRLTIQSKLRELEDVNSQIKEYNDNLDWVNEELEFELTKKQSELRQELMTIIYGNNVVVLR